MKAQANTRKRAEFIRTRYARRPDVWQETLHIAFGPRYGFASVNDWDTFVWPRRSPSDRYLVWLAGRVADLLDQQDRDKIYQPRGWGTLSHLKAEWPGIVDWAKQQGVDLGPMSIDQVIRGSERWHAELHARAHDGDVSQGKVVMKLGDGWTAQELRSKAQFEGEGVAMGPELGRDRVHSRSARIGSLLRDRTRRS